MSELIQLTACSHAASCAQPDDPGVQSSGTRFRITESHCRILRNDWVNAEYKHMVIEGTPAALKAQPGQFFHLCCPVTEHGQPLLRRPMSLYRVSPEEGCIEFLYKVQGTGTRALSTLEPGQTLDVLGPLGKGFDLSGVSSHVLLLGRGVGLATLNPLASRAIAAGLKVTAILSARSPELIMSRETLLDAGATVISVTDAEQNSDVPAIERLLADIHAHHPIDLLATCGSNRLLQLLQRFSTQHDIAGQVAMEQHMGCAIGMCFACVRPFRKTPNTEQLTYRRVCWEGPVFNVNEALSW